VEFDRDSFGEISGMTRLFYPFKSFSRQVKKILPSRSLIIAMLEKIFRKKIEDPSNDP